MKLLSIAIPCYNSEAYMENCIKSLLPGGDEVEILVLTMDPRTEQPRSQMNTRRNIQALSAPSISQTLATAAL